MAKVEQCPGFETFGADVKTAREKVGISRRELAEKIGGRSPVSGQHRIERDHSEYAACGAALSPVQITG